jgi:hypothetical protein
MNGFGQAITELSKDMTVLADILKYYSQKPVKAYL